METNSMRAAQHTPGARASFLNAVANGKHRKGAASRLRSIVAKRERELYGVLACFCCGGAISVSGSTLEHITPQSKGGRTVLENLALSHPLCNERRGDSGSPRAAIAKATGSAA